MDLVIGLLIGIVFGLIFAWIISPKPSGYLKLEDSDPDGPYLFVELNEHPRNLIRRKRVLFMVKIRRNSHD